MKILTLSGLGQPHDTLSDIAPKDATHFDYADYLRDSYRLDVAEQMIQVFEMIGKTRDELEHYFDTSHNKQ